MKIKINKHIFSVVNQKRTNQFYFQIDYDRKYLFHRLFKVKFECGIKTNIHIQYTERGDEWKEFKSVGLFFDTTMSIIRLGIYWHPIVYAVRK